MTSNAGGAAGGVSAIVSSASNALKSPRQPSPPATQPTTKPCRCARFKVGGALVAWSLALRVADALRGGLVALPAGPHTPSALQAPIFGALGGLLMVFSITTLDKLKIDDPVGAISVHGVVGLLGLLLVPVTNDGASFSGQIIGALTIFGWVFVTSAIAFFVIKMVMGLRVSEEEEYEGADLSECGMEAYPEFAAVK